MDPPRKTGQSRFASTVIEQNTGPVREDGVLVAPPVARKPTPVGMPAPPPTPPVDRQSHDNIAHVLEVERLERERAQLLVQLQEAEQAKDAAEREASQLRAPVAPFPPLSVPPPRAKTPPVPPPTPHEVKVMSDIEALEKVVISSRLGRVATVIGIALALVWNAFNSARVRVPEQRVDAVQARQQQNEQLSSKELEAQALERERNIQRWRAVFCWAKQLRGASARQGLDLTSLPPGGVKALRLGDEDPNRPGPPRFVAEEKCSDFPPLPPDIATQ